jgi:hypothetical protein
VFSGSKIAAYVGNLQIKYENVQMRKCARRRVKILTFKRRL